MEYIIDCMAIDTATEFHRQLAAVLSFPEWYGHNLDALYDCLTELAAPTHLILVNWDENTLFADGFRDVFLDAQSDNPDFSVTYS